MANSKKTTNIASLLAGKGAEQSLFSGKHHGRFFTGELQRLTADRNRPDLARDYNVVREGVWNDHTARAAEIHSVYQGLLQDSSVNLDDQTRNGIQDSMNKFASILGQAQDFREKSEHGHAHAGKLLKEFRDEIESAMNDVKRLQKQFPNSPAFGRRNDPDFDPRPAGFGA